MNDFTDMLSKAKEMKKKMEQVQESLKNIEVEGVSGGNLVKIILKGDYEMKSIVMDKNVEKENLHDISVRQALRDAMYEEMKRDNDVFVNGEEVAEYEGAY